MNYEEMLLKGKEKLPEVVNKEERFEVPKVRGHVEGNKTIIVNLFQIADLFSRKPEHMLKYLQRELATPGYFQEKRLIFGRKLTSAMINEKVNRYAEEFVLCSNCNKPDTNLIVENNVLYKKCMACGHKSAIKAKLQ